MVNTVEDKSVGSGASPETYYLVAIMVIICLCGMSISGSSVTQQSIQLHEVIAKDLRSRPISPATRQQLQLLMDQSSRSPSAYRASSVYRRPQFYQ